MTMERFIENKARLRGVPLRGTLELTPLCNLDCKMCYVHLTQKQVEKQSCGMLSGAQWIDIIDQAVALGMRGVTLTGGEALLHPDFEEIFLCLEEKGVQVNLKTNGLLLTDERVAFLVNHHLSSIQISIYGCDDESYERVTGRRVFSQVESAIERIKESGITIELVVTPSKYMWENIKPLIQWVDGLGITYTVNPGLADPFEETGRSGEDHDLTLDQYIELYKFRAELNGGVLQPNCLEDIPPTGGERKDNAVGIRCAAGRSSFSVTWQGMVHPCRMLDSIGFSMLDTSFAEGWRHIHDAAKSYPVPVECFGCDYEGVCSPCVVQHSYGAEIGHASPILCKRAKRMAEEGFYICKKD